jgi:hypothetical protein
MQGTDSPTGERTCCTHSPIPTTPSGHASRERSKGIGEESTPPTEATAPPWSPRPGLANRLPPTRSVFETNKWRAL